MEKKSPFYAFRYLVTPISEIPSLFDQIRPDKKELISSIIQNFSESAKTEKTLGAKRFLFYGFQRNERINIFKFAKESLENIFVEGETDILVEKIKEAKFVYVIIDTENQIILIERNMSVFPKVETSINYLGKILRETMQVHDYAVNIYPLSTNYKFWNYVESADLIYELKIEMNAPNMPLFGNSSTRKLLQQIKNDTNNEKFQMSFINLDGKLKVVKDTMGDYINYILEVGGKYFLSFSKDGVKDTKTSQSDISKTYINRKKEEKYTEVEIENITTKIESIHKLDTRNSEK